MRIGGAKLNSGMELRGVQAHSRGDQNLFLRTISGSLRLVEYLIPLCKGSRKVSLMKVYALVATAIFCCLPAYAGCSGSSPTWTAASANDSDITACVTVASNGDTILVPAGTVSFSAAVDIPNTKCLTINGQGGVTITNSPGFTIEPATTCETRLTGFTFTGTSSNPPNADVSVTSTTSTFCYRIDHNNFNNSSQSIFVSVSGNGPGLLDHNTFMGGGASEDIHNDGTGPSNNAGWADRIVPGGPQMVFIEDNTFSNYSTTIINSGIESFYGARTVLRHNTFNYTQIDQHGSSGSTTNAGSRWWELYDNLFNSLGLNQPSFIVVRSGTGVIWGNTNDGTNTHGVNSIEFTNDNSGTWPQQWQIGAGIGNDVDGYSTCGGSLNNAPAQAWGNQSNFSAYIGNSTDVQQNRDFFFTDSTQPTSIHWIEASGDTCSTTYTYTPYTYPHPLQNGGGQTSVAPPSNLTATVQ